MSKAQGWDTEILGIRLGPKFEVPNLESSFNLYVKSKVIRKTIMEFGKLSITLSVGAKE